MTNTRHKNTSDPQKKYCLSIKNTVCLSMCVKLSKSTPYFWHFYYRNDRERNVTFVEMHETLWNIYQYARNLAYVKMIHCCYFTENNMQKSLLDTRYKKLYLKSAFNFNI